MSLHHRSTPSPPGRAPPYPGSGMQEILQQGLLLGACLSLRRGPLQQPALLPGLRCSTTPTPSVTLMTVAQEVALPVLVIAQEVTLPWLTMAKKATLVDPASRMVTWKVMLSQALGCSAQRKPYEWENIRTRAGHHMTPHVRVIALCVCFLAVHGGGAWGSLVQQRRQKRSEEEEVAAHILRCRYTKIRPLPRRLATECEYKQYYVAAGSHMGPVTQESMRKCVNHVSQNITLNVSKYKFPRKEPTTSDLVELTSF